MSYNAFFVFYKDGDSKEVHYPSDWSAEDIMKAEKADEIMGPYPSEA